MSNFVDVYDVAPGISIDYKNYWESERDVITPALATKGYQVDRWYTTERDSFGPLGRAAQAISPDGTSVTVAYG